MTKWRTPSNLSCAHAHSVALKVTRYSQVAMFTAWRQQYIPTRHSDTHTHTHVDTHDLPGLGHSAAVTATAPRASSHPQLLSRLTAIKVVCEFPKTRHLFRLSLNSTSPSLLFFSLIFLMSIRKIRKDSLLQSSTVHDLLTYSLPCSTSTWIQLCSLASAAGPTSPVLLHPFLPEHLCRRTRALPFPASNSPFDPSAAAHGACTLILLK